MRFIVYDTYKKDFPTHNYIGKTHTGRNTYMGSGDMLKIAIKKYGKYAFARKTLAEFANEDDAYEYEAKMVEEMKPYYNIAAGGRGLGSGESHPNWGSTLNKGLPSSKRPMNAERNKSKEHREYLSKKFAGKGNPAWCGISVEKMREVVSRHETKKAAAAELGIDVKTLRKYIKPAGAKYGDY